MTFYYSDPTQVMYLGGDLDERRALAFHEYLIDLETGAPIRTNLVLDWALYNGIEPDAAIKENGWRELICK